MRPVFSLMMRKKVSDQIVTVFRDAYFSQDLLERSFTHLFSISKAIGKSFSVSPPMEAIRHNTFCAWACASLMTSVFVATLGKIA